jgi:2-polyprenyl-3-methyl-5-hydroxy-6-metoxy-1,4-benzoquinol methylase
VSAGLSLAFSNLYQHGDFMSASHLDTLLRSKADYHIHSMYSHFQSQNYGEALTCYKMAKCILPDFDKDDKVAWSRILYDLGNYFRSVSDVGSAIYCMDNAIEIHPEWEDARQARAGMIISPLHHNSQENVDQLYANPRVVEEYLSAQRIDFYSELYDFCLSSGTSFDGKSIADAGCGPGLLLQIISERSNPQSITGFDFSAEAIKVAKSKCLSGTFHQFDIYSAQNESYDLVFCTETLEHLLYPERAMQNLISMVKPTGQLVLSVPNGRIDTFEGHINFWSPESWNIFIERSCDDLTFSLSLLHGRHNMAVINAKGH